MAYDNGISRKYSFAVYTALWSLVAFTTWVLLPKHKVVNQENVRNSEEQPEGTTQVESTPQDSKPTSSIDGTNNTVDTTPLRRQICSPLFGFFACWFAVCYLRFTLVNSTFNMWVGSIFHGDTAQGMLSRIVYVPTGKHYLQYSPLQK